MTDDRANSYLRTAILTAPPEQLRMMLIDGAVRAAEQAALAMREKRHEAFYNAITQCRAIVMELATSIRDDVDPTLAERVRSVYLFIYRELVDSSLSRDETRLAKAIELLRYEQETWRLLLDKLASERVMQRATPAEPPAPGRSVSLSA